MSASAAIYGLAGEALTPDEKAFFADADPWGFIVFARNLDRPRQIARLCDSLRDCVGRDAPIFIDQEGGRVQRLKAPTWRAAPPAARFGELFDREPEAALEAVRLNHRLIGKELRDVGVDADCAPVVDLAVPGADAVIGDRAFHADPAAVAALATAALEGLKDQGVAGVIKHIPGHGRADADSHHDLPVVRADAETLFGTDFAAFAGVAGAPMAMTAHVVYAAIDPDHCATVSREVIGTIIRGHMGFDGLLMSDDLSMKALEGGMRRRTEDALSAGCDVVLHCNGEMAEMIEIAHAAPALKGEALRRAEAAEAARGTPAELDVEATTARLDALFDDAGLRRASA
ncbi:beta-N-acetylhexosaminidase [Marinicauda salina]|uniref:beta-N-acetylhexosaminidase n=1 Tax=Marinicauda salina TaxID=2135793 RepID=A0A2U2BT01_9PROT|nr:beta-N-acetylhexosaminidase [Marinicauda salina]PWE17143.1 beta-N-acetylhexosaminidase [Marinicauda salina]